MNSVNLQNELLISAVATGLSYATGVSSKNTLLNDLVENIGANIGGSFLSMYMPSMTQITNLSGGYISSGDFSSALTLSGYYKLKGSSNQNSIKKGAILIVSNSVGRIVLDKVLKQ